MNATLAVVALSMLLAADDRAPSEAKSVVLVPWGAGHPTPTGNVYYDFSVWDDGTNAVKLTLHVINNTGHSIAIRKGCLESSFPIKLLDARGRFLDATRGSGSGTMGPQEYMVFDTHLHRDGSYCPYSVVTKRTEIERARFEACTQIEVTDSLSGFLDDMRYPVTLEIKATFDRRTNQVKRGQPTSACTEPSQSSAR